MADKFWIPKTLYDELKKAAADKHVSLREYLDRFFEAIMFGDWEALEKNQKRKR